MPTDEITDQALSAEEIKVQFETKFPIRMELSTMKDLSVQVKSWQKHPSLVNVVLSAIDLILTKNQVVHMEMRLSVFLDNEHMSKS